MRIPARIRLKLKLPEPEGEPWEQDQKTPHGKAYTVGTIVEEYLKSDRFGKLAPNSKKLYLTTLRKFEHIYLKNKDIFSLRAYKVDYALVDYLVKVLTRSVRSSTVQVYFTVMSAVWGYAVRGGRVYYNPWLRPGLSRSQERDITWAKDQIESAISVAKNKGYNLLALYILLGYETGQRLWEDLRNLKWENIKQTEDGKFVIDFTVSKTNTHLIIPLSDRASGAIQAQPKVSALIFVTDKGKHLTSTTLSKQLGNIREEAGLQKKLAFRDLRRTAVTEMAMAGCSTLEIEAITGWRCPDSVLRRYARVRYKTAQNALQKRQELQGNT